MPSANETVPSTPTPDATTLVMAILRVAMVMLGSGAASKYGLSEATLPTLAGAVVAAAGAAWALWEMFRQAKMRNLAAIASARGGKAVEHLDYEPVQKMFRKTP